MLDDDNNDLLAATTEIYRDRLYFVAYKKNCKPRNTPHTHYFSTDDDFIYENFYNDFGPLNLCMLYRYSQKLSTKLNAKCHGNKKIVHYTSMEPAKRLNAAYLIGSYAIIYLHKSPEEVYRRLTAGETPAYTRFCDASYGPSNFKISLLDCLLAVHKALLAGFYNFNDFDAEEYEYYERVENGDFNWIVPQKFIAFCGPHQLSKTLPNGYPCHSPQTYFEYFRSNHVTTVIRLNAKVYHASSFENAGFDHKDLFFVDGSTPSDMILKKFLSICETTKGAIAVHCKAGLGRTGSLIGAYIMKHYNFSALEAIAWLRLCRPGSVIGHQQQWMEDKQAWLWSEGERIRKRTNANMPVHIYGIYSLALKDREAAGVSSQATNENANTIGELMAPQMRGISQRVDTMRLHDGEETCADNATRVAQLTPPSARRDSNGAAKIVSGSRKTRARSLNSGVLGGVAAMPPNSSAMSSLSTSGGSASDCDNEDTVDVSSNATFIIASTRRRKSRNLQGVDDGRCVVGGTFTPTLRRATPQLAQPVMEPLYSEKKLKKPSAQPSAAAAAFDAAHHNKPTIASTVRMTQAAMERKNIAPTQGDKLNQIKAMRRLHNSRASVQGVNNAATIAQPEQMLRHTRARSQPFRNNNNNIALATSPLKQLVGPTSSADDYIAVERHRTPPATTPTTVTADQLNNNGNGNNTINNNNNNYNNNNNNNNSNSFTNVITTRARSLAIYSKRMGLMHLRKSEHRQQATANNNNSSAAHDVTAPTLSSLNKQTKTYNNTLLSSTTTTTTTTSCAATLSESKIPVVRTTAALLDLSGGSSATIPPARSAARSLALHPSVHHMTLRGRSHTRYQQRHHAAAATPSPACTAVTARYYRDVSALPTLSTALPLNIGGSGSVAVDLNSNPLETEAGPHAGRRQIAANNNNSSHSSPLPVSSASRELYTNFDSSTPPPPATHGTACSPLDTNQHRGTCETTTTTTTTAAAAQQLRTGIPVHQHHHQHHHFAAVKSHRHAHETSAAVKRNKRSLSSTRIEKDKDKCDEYNNKLLRKTTTATSGKATITTTSTKNHTTAGSSSGGSYKEGHRSAALLVLEATPAVGSTVGPSSSSSTVSAPAAMPTAACEADGVYVQRSGRYAAVERDQREQQQQQHQQHLSLKLRKKVSY